MKLALDASILDLAARQHGVFTRAQAHGIGFSPKMIRTRLLRGLWRELHPGVYAPGGACESWQQSQLAACFWSRDGLASGRAAGFLRDVPGCDDPPVELLTTNRGLMPRSGIVVHVTKRLPSEQVVILDGIPATTIERTLLDLSGLLPRRAAAIALDAALRRGLTTLGGLDHCLYLTARRGRNGCGVLRKLVQQRNTTGAPHTPLETIVFEMLAHSSLPMPQLQYEIRDERGRFVARPDFVYPRERLIVEAHSKEWHWGQRAASEDAARHNRLVRLDYQILYVTHADATSYRARTLETIGTILERSVQAKVPPEGHRVTTEGLGDLVALQ